MTIDELNTFCKNSFIEQIGIQFTEFDGEQIKAFIELTPLHLQPMGFVHGGVYISLAETIAGAGSSLIVESEGKIALGANVNSQHIASAKAGKIHATGILIHRTDSKHIWDVEISDDSGKLISLSRVSNSIKELNSTKEL